VTRTWTECLNGIYLSPVDRKTHWNSVYTTKAEDEVSWFETLPSISLEMMEAAGLDDDTCVLDVGGGDSHLVDALTARGLDCLAVLDVSGAALQRARTRLGTAAGVPIWIEADVAGDWHLKPMDIWHDRAVFHFLTAADDRAAYRAHMRTVLKRGGTAIIATFALSGPDKCSGLPVARYSPELLAAELGHEFSLVESRSHTHRTPWGTLQAFQYSRFVKARKG
jgi:SAM-dependent methyltransferase